MDLEQVIQLAQDETTPDSKLLSLMENYLYLYLYDEPNESTNYDEYLLRHENYKHILELIAVNPNTSPNALEKLFDYFPLQVLNNISIPLILLENNCFFDNLINTG